MRWFAVLCLVALSCGCARKEPVVSHGKPVGHWVEALRSADPKARQKAVVALGHVGTADPVAVPALTGAIRDPDPTVRRAAVLALLNLGPSAQEAVQALTGATRDKADEQLRARQGKLLSSTLFSNFGYNVPAATEAMAHGMVLQVGDIQRG